MYSQIYISGLAQRLWLVIQMLIHLSCSETASCIWRSSISATLPESQDIQTHSECLAGELYWNNPRGALTAAFTQDGLNKDFNLCLSVSGGNETLTGIYDVSTGDPEELDELYFDTEPVCVESVDGYVFIKFDAKDDLPIQAVISYYKQQTQTTTTTYS